jgi:drug/metabolite transporter (DMT)-like permease
MPLTPAGGRSSAIDANQAGIESRAARTVALTSLALLAFAANSLLCRAALRPGWIDAASFTSLRVAAGALVLSLLARTLHRPLATSAAPRSATRDGLAASALFVYASAFSWAYVRLEAGAGALILFACVQVTMIAWSLARGQRPTAAEYAGLALASAGLVLLTAPGLRAPQPAGAALMALAGLAWGVYSLAGRGQAEPIAANARAFRHALPATLLISAAAATRHVTPLGLLLAVVSGALTSGLGYAAWYAALRGLSAPRAAIVQLAVPVLAALGGLLVLGEPFSLRLLGASALVLGGIALATLRRSRRAH